MRMSLSEGAKRFLARFPKLFHVSQAPSVVTIQQHGLLSTFAIFSLLGIAPEERDLFDSASHATSREFVSATWGSFVINDQAPLNMKGLQSCLTDMTPSEWIANLNRRVFFFPDQTKAERLASAVMGRSRQKILLEFETSELLEHGEEQISFASINGGYTLRKPAARGGQTFRPLADFESNSKTFVKEVTFIGQVPRTTPFRIISAGN